jgi:hypothetical protein
VQHGVDDVFVLCVVFTFLLSFRVAPLSFWPCHCSIIVLLLRTRRSLWISFFDPDSQWKTRAFQKLPICNAASKKKKVPNAMHCQCIAQSKQGGREKGDWCSTYFLPQIIIGSSSIHVDSPGRVGEARVAAVLLLMVLLLLGLMLGLLVMVRLLLLRLLLIMRRRLLLLLLILLMMLRLLLLLAVLVVATARVLHHRIESLVHASDSACATRGRAVRGEVFALWI